VERRRTQNVFRRRSRRTIASIVSGGRHPTTGYVVSDDAAADERMAFGTAMLSSFCFSRWRRFGELWLLSWVDILIRTVLPESDEVPHTLFPEYQPLQFADLIVEVSRIRAT